VRKGLRRFGDCATREEAEPLIPRCKTDRSLQCQGALDWLGCVTFPIDKAAILTAIGDPTHD
jgi:hypothetical protein